jgi:hypothetical protein
MSKSDPFNDPKSITPRPRIFLWGPPGAGKTRCALSLGKCAYISLEKGAQYYADEFDFRLIEPTTFKQIVDAVTWLATNRHNYNTVIIDPITIAWDMVQEEYLSEKRAKKRDDSVEIAGGDWRIIKPRYEKLMKLLTQIDMNVVVIARQTKNYVDSHGSKDDMLKVDQNDPDRPDTEKSTAYIMDTEIQLKADRRAGAVRFMATTRKDRSGKFPTAFEFTGEAVREYFGQIIDQVSKPVELTGDLKPITCDTAGCENTIEPIGQYSAQQIAQESRRQFGLALCQDCRRKAKSAQKQAAQEAA